jgi:predicted nucleotidyltransferase
MYSVYTVHVWYNPDMQPTVNEIAEKIEPVFKKYGVTYAALYGSHARGEARPDSDVDLLVEYSKPLGFEYFDMHHELEENLGREVDVITEESMNEFLRPYIVPDLTPIYGEKR